MAHLRRADPGRRPGRFARVYARVGTTRAMRWISRRIGWRLDPILLRLTGGRLATTLVFPTAVLETRGARTGARRRNAIIYFHDGDDVVIVPSNAGAPRHPDWFHNLRARPDVTFGGLPMVATEVTDAADQARLWRVAEGVFPAFSRFRSEAAAGGRTVPLVRLSPRP